MSIIPGYIVHRGGGISVHYDQLYPQLDECERSNRFVNWSWAQITEHTWDLDFCLASGWYAFCNTINHMLN